MNKKKVLFILHLPPPCHGAAEMGRLIRDSSRVNESFEARYINLSTSHSLEEIGGITWQKLNTLFRLLRQVRKEVRDWKPDLVYLTPSSIMPGLLKDWLVKCHIGGAKVVLHFHNKGVAARQNRILDNFLYHHLFRRSHVILLSPRLYPDVKKYVPADRVSYCPNGIVSSIISSRAESASGRLSRKTRLLFMSNLIRSKGIPELLDACRILKEEGLDFDCEVVGKETKDYSAASLMTEIQEKGLADRVHFTGPKYGADKWSALSGADVFVFPSWYPAECFPLVLLEAMAAGLPVVTTDEGAIPDMVRDGENGFICPAKDSVSIADAIRNLLDNSDLCVKMGECGHQRYQEEFTARAFESRLIGILNKELDA